MARRAKARRTQPTEQRCFAKLPEVRGVSDHLSVVSSFASHSHIRHGKRPSTPAAGMSAVLPGSLRLISLYPHAGGTLDTGPWRQRTKPAIQHRLGRRQVLSFQSLFGVVYLQIPRVTSVVLALRIWGEPRLHVPPRFRGRVPLCLLGNMSDQLADTVGES